MCPPTPPPPGSLPRLHAHTRAHTHTHTHTHGLLWLQLGSVPVHLPCVQHPQAQAPCVHLTADLTKHSEEDKSATTINQMLPKSRRERLDFLLFWRIHATHVLCLPVCLHYCASVSTRCVACVLEFASLCVHVLLPSQDTVRCRALSAFLSAWHHPLPAPESAEEHLPSWIPMPTLPLT